MDETFDLGEFFRDNPAGVILSIALLVMVCFTALRSAKVEYKTRSHYGRSVTHTHLSRSIFFERHQSLYANDWPVCESVRVFLRTRWSCGSLCYPIEGDPMNRSQRLFCITATMIVTCAVNIMFHQLGDNSKEICETSQELGRRCTDELASRGRCICAVYACDSPGCNDCVACDTLASCDASCDEVEPPGLRPVVLCSLVVNPIVFCLNLAFKWWHRPVTDAIAAMVASNAKTSAEDESSIADTGTDSVVAERRTACTALLPYGLAVALAAGSIFVIASVSRPLPGRLTWEWIRSVILSLAFKWIIVDPVKVILLTPMLMLVRQWSQRVTKFLSALCLGTTDPPQLRQYVKRVIVLERSLKSISLQLMRDRIDAVRERDTAALSRTYEEKMSMAKSDDVRKRLKTKHQKQRQEMLDRLAAVDRQLEQVVEGQRNAHDCFAHVAGNYSPDTRAARMLMHKFDKECHQAMATVRQNQQGAAEVRLLACFSCTMH